MRPLTCSSRCSPRALIAACAVWILLATGGAVEPAAQSVSVNGFVRDAETGETLLQATVTVQREGEERTTGSVTNEQGFYALSTLAPGSVTLVASYVGYQRETRTLTLAPGETRRIDFALSPENLGGEVVVQAEQDLGEERDVGLQNVPVRLVEELPSVFEDDLFRSIQLLPGVKASSDFSSKLYIRGGSPDQTLILLDGTTVYNPTHFFGFFSTFNTDAIKDATLYKGAYPPEFGGRLGSVLDIYNKDGNRNRVAGGLSLGLLASRARIEGPIGMGQGGSFMVAARRSTLEPLLGFLRENLDQDGIPETFYFYDVNAKVGVDVTPNDRVTAAAYLGRDIVEVPFGEDARFNLDYGNRTLSVGYNRVLSRSAFLQTRATASRYQSEPVGEIAGTTFRRPNEITDLSSRADLEVAASEAVNVQAGLWGGYFDLSLESFFNGERQIDFRSPSGYVSGYGQAAWEAAPGWTFSGGLRAEYFGRGRYLRLSPQVKLERAFGNRAVIQLAAGRYHQFLSLISNEAFSGFDTWVTVGEGVPPQESDQVSAGLKTRLGGGYRFDVEVYGRTLRDIFNTRPELQDVAGLDYEELFRFGEGYAYGAEFLVEKGAGPLTGLLGYTLGVTRRRYPDEPAFSESFAPKYDRLHDLTLVTSYDVGAGWTVNLTGSYATGQAYTEPDARYRVDGVPFIGDATDYALYSETLNGARLAPYHRADVGVTRRGRFFGIGEYELQLQAVNVYNRRNVWFVTYDFDENPVRVEPVRQLPILPNVSFSLDF